MPVRAEKKSGFYDSQDGDLLAYVEGMRKSFAAAGLSVIQCPSFDPDRGPNGTVEVTTILLHESGEFVQSSMQLQPEKPGPQAVGSATTYAKRYALASMTRQVASETASGIPEDDDAESAEKDPKDPKDNPSGMKKPKVKVKKPVKKRARKTKTAAPGSSPRQAQPLDEMNYQDFKHAREQQIAAAAPQSTPAESPPSPPDAAQQGAQPTPPLTDEDEDMALRLENEDPDGWV